MGEQTSSADVLLPADNAELLQKHHDVLVVEHGS